MILSPLLFMRQENCISKYNGRPLGFKLPFKHIGLIYLNRADALQCQPIVTGLLAIRT